MPAPKTSKPAIKNISVDTRNEFMWKVYLLLFVQCVLAWGAAYVIHTRPNLRDRLAKTDGKFASGGAFAAVAGNSIFARLRGKDNKRDSVSVAQYLAATAGQAQTLAGATSVGDNTRTMRVALMVAAFMMPALLASAVWSFIQRRYSHSSKGAVALIVGVVCISGLSAYFLGLRDFIGGGRGEIIGAAGGTLALASTCLKAGDHMMVKGSIDPINGSASDGANLVYTEAARSVKDGVVNFDAQKIKKQIGDFFRGGSSSGTAEMEMLLHQRA